MQKLLVLGAGTAGTCSPTSSASGRRDRPLGVERRWPSRSPPRSVSPSPTRTGRRSLRKDFAEQGETATLRRISTVGGIPTKTLFQLFPQKPAKKLSYVAGLPKPYGCV